MSFVLGNSKRNSQIRQIVRSLEGGCNFSEALFVPAPRGLKDIYRVQDLRGRFHAFYSADEANSVFPGAFDRHPDYAEQVSA